MLNVRTVELQDAENLVNIYRPYVEHTAITFDYTVPSVHEFEEKISKSIQSYPFLVAEEGDDELGTCGETLAQQRILRGHAHRAGVQVALAHHDAP